ncbi:hypothetical protein PR202_ga11146 [Eleusine coracana subsp. coracana]|uniref:4-coumarate--CoA ligase n=1 Tax=Eleusine coracana subsp. coracana TaxID=191504 RepID=A0AAV5C8F8_ELECO|nr:hypothetical protein PR202_ga11146 [Eleusine coracana subsp. coracana]
MEANPKNIFTIKVEDGKPGKDGRPSVGPVFRSSLAKDGFPPLEADMHTSWDVFRTAAGKYPNNRMLGWRPFKDGVVWPYLWKSYKEVYDEVLQAGSALQKLGLKPGSRVGIYGTNCPQWIVAMQDKKIKEILSPNCKSAKRLKALVTFTSATSEQIREADQIGMKMYSWNDFLKLGKDNPAQPCPPKADDTCTIMYTSGTSGQPKGVMLSHESHAMYVKGVDLFMDQFDDKDLNALRDDLMELKPTLLVGVPRVYERIHEGGILKAIAELRPLRRVIFNALYNRKLASMKAGHSHKTASPFADMLAFRKLEYLEKVYGFPPLVEDIWVYGDSFRSNLVAVVNPHEENTMKWAESNGYKGSFDEICKLEGLKEYILKELTAVAQKNKLRGFEFIKGVALDPKPFDIERDLVTATMKKRRNNMLKYYQPEIDKLYKRLEDQKNAAKAR